MTNPNKRPSRPISPAEIAKLLSEDINVNNGFIQESFDEHGFKADGKPDFGPQSPPESIVAQDVDRLYTKIQSNPEIVRAITMFKKDLPASKLEQQGTPVSPDEYEAFAAKMGIGSYLRGKYGLTRSGPIARQFEDPKGRASFTGDTANPKSGAIPDEMLKDPAVHLLKDAASLFDRIGNIRKHEIRSSTSIDDIERHERNLRKPDDGWDPAWGDKPED